MANQGCLRGYSQGFSSNALESDNELPSSRSIHPLFAFFHSISWCICLFLLICVFFSHFSPEFPDVFVYEFFLIIIRIFCIFAAKVLHVSLCCLRKNIVQHQDVWGWYLILHKNTDFLHLYRNLPRELKSSALCTQNRHLPMIANTFWLVYWTIAWKNMLGGSLYWLTMVIVSWLMSPYM